MKIFINDHPIQFELSGEKNAGEIVNSLYQFAEKEKMVIADLTINGKSYKTDQDLSDQKVESIKEIHLKLLYPVSFAIATLKEAEQALSSYAQKINRDYVLENFDKITQHLSWLNEIFEKTSEILSLQREMHPLQIYLKELVIILFAVKNKDADWNEERATALVKTIRDSLDRMKLRFDIKAIEEALTRKTQKTECTLLDLSELIENATNVCEEIAVNFQVGKQLEALSKIIDFSDAIELYEKSMGVLIAKEETLKQNFDTALLDEICEKLKMIEQSSETKDFVELADIFEYEMKPALEKLKNKTTALV